MNRRALSQMLSDVGDGALAAQDRAPFLRPQRVEIAVPLEVWVRERDGEIAFLADLPLCRWRTAFDQTPSQLRITWEAVEPA